MAVTTQQSKSHTELEDSLTLRSIIHELVTEDPTLISDLLRFSSDIEEALTSTRSGYT